MRGGGGSGELTREAEAAAAAAAGEVAEVAEVEFPSGGGAARCG